MNCSYSISASGLDCWAIEKGPNEMQSEIAKSKESERMSQSEKEIESGGTFATDQMYRRPKETCVVENNPENWSDACERRDDKINDNCR